MTSPFRPGNPSEIVLDDGLRRGVVHKINVNDIGLGGTGRYDLVVQHTGQLLRGQATWYLALTYLKKEEVEASKTQLRKLAGSTARDRYAEAARQLLADLE